MCVQRNNDPSSRNHCCRGKAISITYFESVCVCVCVALVIQHARHRRRTVISSAACLALQDFSTISKKMERLSEKCSGT